MPDGILNDSAAETATVATLAARLTAAIVCGLVVAAIYRGTRGRDRVAASFPGTLVMLCVLIAMVTQVLGENIALAFSLVGGLSIVRFRTVVQDTTDTAFVIFAVAVGMAIGAGQPLVAICGTVAAGSVAWMFRERPDERSGRDGQSCELTIRMAADAAAEPQVHDVLARVLLFTAVVPIGFVTRAADAEEDAAAAVLFDQGSVPRLEIRLTEEAAESLRRDPRAWTTCTLVENGERSHEEVAVKIKGGYGSTRDLDDRPALTLNMDKHVAGRRFHGLDRFHLNNSVQDESLLRELLGSTIFRDAGIPTPRVAHARVWIGGRDVGLYVLKESFDADFLRRSFPQPDGNLYDGGLLQDIDDGLERDEGERGEPGSDLAELAAACRTLDDAARWRAIEARLDLEAFLTFAAVEAMTGHWDGYCSARNNYRIYMDPAAGGRARFLPHGMDQIFGDAGARIHEPPAALVAMAVLENPSWRRRYRQRVRELLPLFAAEARLLPLLDATAGGLRPIVLDMGPEALERFTAAVHDLRNLVVAREANLREQAESPEPLVWPTRLQAAVRALNAAATTTEELSIPDSQATDFLRANVPWFECPDLEIERDYYRRWWTLRRHIRHTDAGPVIDNLPPAFGDPLTEVRWLRDLRISGLDALRAPEAAANGPRTCDSVITDAIGLKLHPDTTVEVHPAPPHGWKWFAMDRIAYHGRLVTVVWDQTGEHYGQGPGLRVFVDGHEVARADSLRRLVGRLP